MAFSFTLPVVGTTVDPTWSQEFLDAFNQLEAHTHTGLSGDAAQINASSLLITSDFTVNGFNLINPRSVIFQNLSSDPNGINDICSIYFKNGNFYINNQIGSHVQITNGNTINVAGTVASVFSYRFTNTNFNLLNTDTYTYLAIDTTNPRSIFLPAASTVPTGRFITLKDSTGNSESAAISIVPAGADTIDTVAANYVVKKTFGSWMLVSNGVNGWLVSNYSNKNTNNGLIESNGAGIHLAGLSDNVLIDSTNEILLQLNTNQILMSGSGLLIYTPAIPLILDSGGNNLELRANPCILTPYTGTVFQFQAVISSNTTDFDHSLTAKSISLGLSANQYDGQINGQVMLSGLQLADASQLLSSNSPKVVYYTSATTGRTITLDPGCPNKTQFKIVNPTGQTIRVTDLGSFDKNLTTNKWCQVWKFAGAWAVIGYGDLL